MGYPVIDNLPPVHPGEILADELEALGMSKSQFARHLGLDPNAITRIVNGQHDISAKMALRLAQAFGTSVQYWLNLQDIYDTKLARAELDVSRIAPLVAA